MLGLWALILSGAPGMLAAQSTPTAESAESAERAPLRLRLERVFGSAAQGDETDRPVFASGRSVRGTPGGRTVIEGEAEVRRGGTRVQAERIGFDAATEEVAASGEVRVTRGGDAFTGPSLNLNLATGIGTFESPSYEISASGGRGDAQRVDFEGDRRVVLRDATYTTCPCGNDDWFLRAESLTIDGDESLGEGRNASLTFKGLKLFTLPVFWFPTTDERRSGFLPPSFAINSRTGIEAITPYYLNIAPNLDLTLSPRFMTRRGLLLGSELRYLQPNFFGTVRVDYNPRDLVTDTDRYQWSWRHSIERLGGWRGQINYNGVSDDNYLIDYGGNIVDTSERNLPRDIYLTRPWSGWQVLVRATQFQSILDARDAPPYQRLPQLQMRRTVRDSGGLDISTVLDATRFTRRLDGAVEGTRLVAHPQISWPILRPEGFLIPTLSVHASAYSLDGPPGLDRSINRVVPTFQVDGGLVFERDKALFGHEVRQTLEPRLYYSYTPYRDQDAIPVFDTAPSEFSFAQLFAPNLYVGDDRIADLNQLTAALQSRILDPATGAERLRFAIGQRLYFSDRRVTIPGVPARTDRRSDVLLAASGEISNALSFDSGMQFSLGDTSLPRFNLAIRYLPGPERVINFGIRYQRDELGQIDTSAQWPLGRRWTGFGRVNYSWIDQRIDPVTGLLGPTRPGVIESVLGLQYRTDCWATRFVVQRFVTAEDTNTTAFFIQLELDGLGRIGTDPFAILRRNIPGLSTPESRLNIQDDFSVYQ